MATKLLLASKENVLEVCKLVLSVTSYKELLESFTSVLSVWNLLVSNVYQQGTHHALVSHCIEVSAKQ
jgi:hypothetical protein